MPDPALPPHVALARLAAGQRNVFSLVDARRCGWKQAAIDARRRSGQWHRVTRGAYADAQVWAVLTDEQKHIALAQARLLLLSDGWIVARRSAAVAHGLPLIGKAPTRAQLVRHPSSPLARAVSRHERLATLPSTDATVVGGLPCTSLARTVFDIARAEERRNGVIVADAALRCGLSDTALSEAATRMAAWPGGSRAAGVARFADGRSESPLESLSRVLFDEHGLDPPELQIEIWVEGRFEARVDFLWREQRTIGEADGRGKYGTVDDLYAEKRREERLRDLGFEVVRWGWDEVWRPDPELVPAIRRSMTRGRLNALAPDVALRSAAVPVLAQRRQASSLHAA